MIKKIVSGGQTGADQGGLELAREMGIECGGWAPRGYITEKGACPELRDFGLVETYDDGYVTRTLRNVRDSDGTIRIATNFQSRGELCTMRGIKRHRKPHFDVSPSDDFARKVSEAANWVRTNNIETLNVAGNSESKSPGIRDFTVKFLRQMVFELRNCSA